MRKQKISAATGVIMLLGALMRLFYICGTTIYERQYDIGKIDLAAGHTVTGGHLAYIQYLYENWHLPDIDPTTVYQFHHPPLHHAICALWMKFCSLFITDLHILEESIQIVPFVCSLLVLFFLYKILREFSLKEKTIGFLMLLFSFHPTLILFSGSVNNDSMALLFEVLCVYTALVWCKKPTMGNIIKMALAIALGMLTKLNVAEFAFPMAAVFLYMFFKNRKQWKTYIRQFLVFGVISIPLGMSFEIRNMIRYQTPLVYVYTLPEDSWQYVGNYSLTERFLLPKFSEILDCITSMKIGMGYNTWVQLFRTAAMGEWNMDQVAVWIKIVAVLLMAAVAAFGILAFVCFIKAFFGKRFPIPFYARLFFLIAYGVTMFFYLDFVYQYPQQCSMHFRYIAIALLFPAVGLGFCRQETAGRKMLLLENILMGAFVVLSVVMTGVWCFF